MLLSDLESKLVLNPQHEKRLPEIKKILATHPNTLLQSNDSLLVFILTKCTDCFNISNTHFLINLKKEDDFIFYKSLSILTAIYSQNIPSKEYLEILFSRLGKDKKQNIQILFFVQKILNRKNDSKKVKRKFMENSFFMGRLVEFLTQPELQYSVLIVLWILSFDRRSTSVFRAFLLFDLVLELLGESQKEKLQRICFLILGNAYELGFKFCISKTTQLQKIIERLKERIVDEETVPVLEYLNSRLSEIQREGSSLKHYFYELFENKLDESKCHYDHVFWDINIDKIMKKKVEIIKALKKYLRSHDRKIVCIASNDVYMMLKHAPEIYYYVEKFKLKDDLVRLSFDESDDIRFHATQALTSCIYAQWA